MQGCTEDAPFNAIHVGASAAEIPQVFNSFCSSHLITFHFSAALGAIKLLQVAVHGLGSRPRVHMLIELSAHTLPLLSEGIGAVAPGFYDAS